MCFALCMYSCQDEEELENSADDEDSAAGVTLTNNKNDDVKRSPTDRLDYFQSWSQTRQISYAWQSSFLSKRVRVTRGEVLNLVCRMLDIETNLANRVRVLRELEFMSFGSIIEQDSGTLKRKFVGICPESPKRRDFVRIFCDDPEDYCWAAEILMFIKITGFSSGAPGFVLPEKCRTTTKGPHDTVLVALVRWSSPHPNALLKDDKRRPICPPPLDFNHALWKYTEEERVLVTQAIMHHNLTSFPGSSVQDRLESCRLEEKARYDLLIPDSFEEFMNCTRINVGMEDNVLLETVTLPF